MLAGGRKCRKHWDNKGIPTCALQPFGVPLDNRYIIICACCKLRTVCSGKVYQMYLVVNRLIIFSDMIVSFCFVDVASLYHLVNKSKKVHNSV